MTTPIDEHLRKASAKEMVQFAAEHGIRQIKLMPNSKKPAGKWNPCSLAELCDWIDRGGNVGWLMGGGLITIDVDKPAVEAGVVKSLDLGGGGTVTILTPNGGYHFILATPEKFGCSSGDLPANVDVRGEGGYIVAPWSRHPNGGIYQPCEGCGPGEVGFAELPSNIAEQIRAPKANSDLPAEPSRSTPPASVDQAEAYCEKAVVNELQAVVAAPKGTRNHRLNEAAFNLGQLVGGGYLDRAEVVSRLSRAGLACGLNANEVNRTIRSGIEAGMDKARVVEAPKRVERGDADSAGSDDDPPTIPFGHGDLPPLPAQVLPGWVRDFALAIAETRQIDATFTVLLSLPILAACVMRRFYVRVLPEWSEPLPIFAAAIMESGERKTAALSPLLKPLNDLEAELRERAAKEAEQLRVKRRLAQERCRELERRHRKSDDSEEREKLEKEIAAVTQGMPPEPRFPQIVFEDTTQGAAVAGLAANGEAGLQASDEGGVFLNFADRFNTVEEVDLHLKAHTAEPFRVNRVGTGATLLRRPLLSVAVSPQPGIMRRLGERDSFHDRGLLARFLMALPKSRAGNRDLHHREIDASTRATYGRNLQRLARMNRDHDGSPSILAFDQDAADRFADFYRDIERQLGAGGPLGGRLKSWASKLSGAVARIAAVCHAAEHGDDAGLAPIDLERTEAAIELGYALIPHAAASFELMGGGSRDMAKIIAEFDAVAWRVSQKDDPPADGTATRTEWYDVVQKIVGGDRSSCFDDAAADLIEHGYLIEVEAKVGRKFRPNRRLLTNEPEKPA